MIPISEINVGDLFANPAFINLSCPGLIYRVERINLRERLILIQAYSGTDLKPFGTPLWKSNKDRLFSESWRYGNML